MKKVLLSLSLVVFLLAGFTTVANANVVSKATTTIVADDNSPVYQEQDKKKEVEAAKTNTKTDGCDKGVKTSCDKSAATSCDKSKTDASKATTTDKKADADKK
jgi:hypothetical protein